MSPAEEKARARKVAKALTPMVNACLMARAHAQLMREAVTPIYAAVLDFCDVHDKDGTRITDPDKAWHMHDKYAADYYAECDKRIREAGYEVEPGYCPALIAEGLQRDAERLLIQSAAEHVPGLDYDRLLCAGLGKLKECVRLLEGLVVNSPGYKPVQLQRA